MRPRATALLARLALLAGAAGCDAPTVPGEAPAYDPTVLTGGRLYHWPLGATLRLHVHGATEADRAALRDAVEAGVASWRAELRYRELGVRLVERPEEADVVVGPRGAAHPVALDACGGFDIGAALTLLCPDADGARTLPLRSGAASRVKLAVAVDPAAAASPAGLRALVVHELGHVFGIGGHSPEPSDVMHPQPTVTAPSARDRRTLRYVLHRPADLRL